MITVKTIKIGRVKLCRDQVHDHQIKLQKFRVLRAIGRILEANEDPPVSSFTLASKKGVSALPVMFFSLRSKDPIPLQKI